MISPPLPPTDTSFNISVPEVVSSKYPELARELSNARLLISSPDSFNQSCMAIVQAWRSAFPRRLGSTRDFASVIRTIDSNTPTTGQIVIQVPAWGGVLVTEIDIERVNVGKFLAVRSGRYLALEWHEAKDEHMACREGAGLLLYRHGITGPLSVMVMTPGAEIDLKPGDVHCLIACEDLLIYETSKDRKGMDQDLKFIYLPQ